MTPSYCNMLNVETEDPLAKEDITKEQEDGSATSKRPRGKTITKARQHKVAATASTVQQI